MSYTDAYKTLKKESAQESMSHVPFGWGTVETGQSNLTIEIEPMVFYKIMHWIHKEDYECSGLGMVEIDHETNTLRVTDAILLTQQNTSATTELDGHAIGAAMHEFRQRETPGMLKWWWHSHVNMDVFWSGTDKDAIKCLGGGDTETSSWFVATVFNKQQKMLSAFVQNRPIKMIQTGINTNVRVRIEKNVVEAWDAEYDEKVELPAARSGGMVISGEERFELWSQWKERQDEKIQEQLEVKAEEPEEEVTDEERQKKLDAILDSDTGWNLEDLEGALERGMLNWDDIFALHDQEEITDDELNYLFGSIPDDEEADKMDITKPTPVTRKQLIDM